LYIDFKDGDGDLGLRADETDFPYNPKNYYLADGKGGVRPIGTYSEQITTRGGDLVDILSPVLIPPSDFKGKLITARTRNNPAYDTFPTYPSTFPCQNYAYSYDSVFILEPDTAIFNKSYYIKRIINTSPKVYVLQDTLYSQRNPNGSNISVDFMVEQSNGTFKPYEWLKESSCDDFNKRFPVLSDRNGPLEGTLRYGMVSKGLTGLFGNKRMYLRVQIRDRALHVSNVETTPPFTLNSIRK